MRKLRLFKGVYAIYFRIVVFIWVGGYKMYAPYILYAVRGVHFKQHLHRRLAKSFREPIKINLRNKRRLEF